MDSKKKSVSQAEKLKAVKAVIGRFDPDFDSPADFVKRAIEACYPGRKPAHAAKIVRELFPED